MNNEEKKKGQKLQEDTAPAEIMTLKDIQDKEAAADQRRADLQKEIEEIEQQKNDYIREHEKMPNWEVLKPLDGNLKKLDAVIAYKVQEKEGLSPHISQEDVKNAWSQMEKEFRDEMTKAVGNYYEAKRNLYEMYVTMIVKQNNFLAIRDNLSDRYFHADHPTPWYDSTDELPFTSVLPHYEDDKSKFFKDIARDGDYYWGCIDAVSRGVRADLKGMSAAASVSNSLAFGLFLKREEIGI